MITVFVNYIFERRAKEQLWWQKKKKKRRVEDEMECCQSGVR